MRPDGKLVFHLLPLGEIPVWVMSYIGKLIVENFGARTVRLESWPLLEKSYLPEKEAYDANDLLDSLKIDFQTRHLNIIEITAAQIYDPTGGGTYLDGMAFLGGPALLISMPGDTTKPSDEAKTAIRNILLHELGHFFGLTDRGCGQTLLWRIKHFFGFADRGQCLMNDKARSTTADMNYCAACRKRIVRALARKAWQR